MESKSQLKSGYTIELQEALQVCTLCMCLRDVCVHVYAYNYTMQALLASGMKFAVHTTAQMEYCKTCDANFVKAHPVFKTYPDALQFILFYDDI